MTDRSQSSSVASWVREWLAISIVSLSVVAIAVLGTMAIHYGQTDPYRVLEIILPMVATWVGTVLAFYFGSKQMEVATQSVTAIQRAITPDEKLKSIPVTDKMILPNEMYARREDLAQVTVQEAIDGLEKAKKGDRLPMLTAQDLPVCVLHRSVLDRFVSMHATAGRTQSLRAVLDDPALKPRLEHTFGVVPEGATLADAKQKMRSLSWCQDVFVTATGLPSEPVLGWITNAIIESSARV